MMWYREGVLLIFSDKLSSLDVEAEVNGFDIPEFSAGDQGKAVRMSLEQAIHLVISISNATTKLNT